MKETARRVAAATGIAAAVAMCGLSVARTASGTTGSPAPPDTSTTTTAVTTTTTTTTTTALPTRPTATVALHGGGGGHTSQEPIASLFSGAPTGTNTETPTTTPRAKPDKVATAPAVAAPDHSNG